jgi:hypothetical protein
VTVGPDPALAGHLLRSAASRPGRADLERLFRAGALPAPPPAGFAAGTFLGTTLGGPADRLVGTLAARWMPWLGKAFDALAGGGENVFVPGPGWYAAGLLRLGPLLGWPIRRDAGGRLRGFPFVTEPGRGVADPGVPVLRIVYADPRAPNPYPVREVLDELVQVGSGLLLGKAHLRTRAGRWRQVAFFSLRQAPDGPARVPDARRAEVDTPQTIPDAAAGAALAV